MSDTVMESSSSQPPPATLEYLEGHDAGLFRILKTEVESLKEMSKRTQVKGLKESVDQVISIIGSIEHNNAELRALRSQLARSKLMVVDARKVVTILIQNMNTAVKESNKIVLDAISSAGVRSTGANWQNWPHRGSQGGSCQPADDARKERKDG